MPELDNDFKFTFNLAESMLLYKLCTLCLAFEFVRLFPYDGNLVFLQLTTDIGVVLKSCTNQSSDTKQLEESMSQLNSTPEAARLSSLLHLTCLLFEVSSLLVCVQSVCWCESLQWKLKASLSLYILFSRRRSFNVKPLLRSLAS